MELLDFSALDAAPVATEPFRHVLVPRFVPPSVLGALRRDFPIMGRRGSFPAGSLRLGPLARDLVAALEGGRMRASIGHKLGMDLRGAATMLTVRGWTNDRDGHIHTDSRGKQVTCLLYLNEDTDEFEGHKGCLRLLRGPASLEDYAVEVPPVNGMLLIFPNAANAWHGHAPFTGPRLSMQLNYMTTDGWAKSELRRHRFSALLKRLVPA